MPDSIDFEQLFARLPSPYMILDRELRFVAANEAYLQVTASQRDDLLGRRLFDLFPNDPDDPNNLPARMLRTSLERVLETGEPDALALIPYRVPAQRGSEIVTENRFWSATHTPLLDRQGEVAFILQHTEDVTELERLRRGEAELSDESGMLTRVGAGVISRAAAVQDANRRLDDDRQHMHALFAQAPGFMCFLQGPQHTFALVNQAYLRLVGHRNLLGRPVREALPEVAGQGFYELLDRVYATGEPFVGEGLHIALQRTPGDPLEDAFLDFIYQPMRDAEGAIQGIFVQGHDVTQREAARLAAEAFSVELATQSVEVKRAFDEATSRIRELEAELARRS